MSPSRILGLLEKFDRAAWLRFFGAVAGLSVALLAAIYSTVFRERGDVWAMVTLASLSLIIAGVVTFTTVPYLARRVAGGRLRQSFQYEFTKAGAAFLAMTVLIGVA